MGPKRRKYMIEDLTESNNEHVQDSNSRPRISKAVDEKKPYMPLISHRDTSKLQTNQNSRTAVNDDLKGPEVNPEKNVGPETEEEILSYFDEKKYLKRKQKEHDELQQNYPFSDASSISLEENRLKKVQKVN